MFDAREFLNEERACLVAPAGYGKTHAIIECLKISACRQLILTHTHAGVSSLKSKIEDAGIPSARYELLTILAFAQRLAVAYTRPEYVPTPTVRNSEYFHWTLSRAKELLDCKIIGDIISVSYGGIIVDEYQDCTIAQHELIMKIATKLPLHVLGDPMQGIFCFEQNPPLVDFEADLSCFQRYRLTMPYRWLKTNPRLGQEIAELREQLSRGSQLDYSHFQEIKHVNLTYSDYKKCFIGLCASLRKEGPTVVIVSNSRNKEARRKVARLFGGRCSIVEAIDDWEFYELAQQVDGLTQANAKSSFCTIAGKLFFRSSVNEWITTSGLKNKKDEAKRNVSRPLSAALDRMEENPSAKTFLECLHLLSKLPGVTLLNHEKFFSLSAALQGACQTGASVIDAMVKERDMVRGMGRRITRFAVGTTLLIKGLEFDNVIIVNAGYKFDLQSLLGRRNFYVAISRARKKLHIIDVV